MIICIYLTTSWRLCMIMFYTDIFTIRKSPQKGRPSCSAARPSAFKRRGATRCLKGIHLAKCGESLLHDCSGQWVNGGTWLMNLRISPSFHVSLPFLESLSFRFQKLVQQAAFFTCQVEILVGQLAKMPRRIVRPQKEKVQINDNGKSWARKARYGISWNVYKACDTLYMCKNRQTACQHHIA